MESLIFSNASVYTSVWLPFGRSNMEALNRFVGSHKRYTSPTEFGVQGEIEDMGMGSISMQGHGVYLTPVDYDFTGFLKAKIKKKYGNSQTHGLSLYKSGLSVLGIQLDEPLSIDEAKIINGQLNRGYTSFVFPLLTDVQISMMNGLYEETDLDAISNKLHSYSLLKCQLDGVEFADSGDFLDRYPNHIDAFTDWIISHSSLDGCHIFVGMAGCLCIGETTERVEELLKYILYEQTCMKTAQRLHSLLWSTRRRIHKLRCKIKESTYNILKESNECICEMDDILSKVNVFDQLLRFETKDIYSGAGWLKEGNNFEKQLYRNFEYEIEKSQNREITIHQLTEGLGVMSSELENRLELIMTKDNTQLNLILLILTVISVLGVAEANNFSAEQWGIVSFFLIPFGFFVFMYIRKLRKNYYFSILKRRKKNL